MKNDLLSGLDLDESVSAWALAAFDSAQSFRSRDRDGPVSAESVFGPGGHVSQPDTVCAWELSLRRDLNAYRSLPKAEEGVDVFRKRVFRECSFAPICRQVIVDRGVCVISFKAGDVYPVGPIETACDKRLTPVEAADLQRRGQIKILQAA